MLSNKQFSFTYWIAVLVFLIFTLGPLVWAIIISLTPSGELMKSGSHLIPEVITLNNFKEILDPNQSVHQTIFLGLRNSLLCSLSTILIGLPMAVMAAYAVVRFKLIFRNLFVRLLLITIVIPVFTTIIPIFAIYSKYRLLDSLFWISVIFVTSYLPLTTWMLINFFRRIPIELWEAAELDGCSEWEIFWQIVLPISRTAIITCVLILLLMSWSQFQIPMILTSSQDNKVITLVLSEFMTRDAIDYGMIAASGLIAIIPPALIVIVFRKDLVSGLTAGAVKG